MSTTLTNGLKLPDKGSVDWYANMQNNYTILDGAVGTIAEHTSALAGKAPLVHTHTKSDVTDLLNSNFIPSANNSYDLGSSSNQWNNLYAKNYYYNGVAWGLDKANTWTNLQSYTQSIKFKVTYTIGTVPSSELYGGFNFGNSDTNLGNVTARVSSTGATYTRLYIGNKFTDGALDPNGTWKYAELQVGLRANGDRFIYTDCLWRSSLTPYDSNLNLGDSTHKWKTLNGINPGALSLPSSHYVEIGTNGWDLSGTTYNRVYINNANPTFPGILFIRINSTTLPSIIVRLFSASGTEITYSGNKMEAANNNMIITVPCPPSTNIYVMINTSSSISTCRYYTLLGDPEFDSRSGS